MTPDRLVACLQWANAGRTGQTRCLRLAILSYLAGYDRERLPTLAAVAASQGVSRQAAAAQVDDLKAWFRSMNTESEAA